jgi:hypothetical protein
MEDQETFPKPTLENDRLTPPLPKKLTTNTTPFGMLDDFTQNEFKRWWNQKQATDSNIGVAYKKDQNGELQFHVDTPYWNPKLAYRLLDEESRQRSRIRHEESQKQNSSLINSIATIIGKVAATILILFFAGFTLNLMQDTGLFKAIPILLGSGTLLFMWGWRPS